MLYIPVKSVHKDHTRLLLTCEVNHFVLIFQKFLNINTKNYFTFAL